MLINKNKLIRAIDLWNQDDDFEEIILPAITDEFDINNQIYDSIKIIKNCRVDYIKNKSVLPSRSNVILFLSGKKPVRLVLLKQGELDKVLHNCFNAKCLPNNVSVFELEKQGKLKISETDLKQKPHNEFKVDYCNGSCDRMSLLKSMLTGSIMADGNDEKSKLKRIKYDKDCEMTVHGDIGEYIIKIPHKGCIELEFEDIKRHIYLQDNKNMPLKEVEELINKKLQEI